MGSHVYKFTGHFSLQTWGGSIGLALTAWLASLIMRALENLWVKLLLRNNIKILDFLRYLDDCRNIMVAVNNGWRWYDGQFVIRRDWELEAFSQNLPDDASEQQMSHLKL